MLSPSSILQAPTLIACFPTGPYTCCWILVSIFSTHCAVPRGIAVFCKLQGYMLWWFILAWFAVAQCRVSQRPAKIPTVLIMFAFCCLSVVPVCFYSHPSAKLRIAAFLLWITPQQCGPLIGASCGQWKGRERQKGWLSVTCSTLWGWYPG